LARDLHKIEAGIRGAVQRFLQIDNPVVLSIIVDELNLASVDGLVDARPFLALRGPLVRSACYGADLLCCLTE